MTANLHSTTKFCTVIFRTQKKMHKRHRGMDEEGEGGFTEIEVQPGCFFFNIIFKRIITFSIGHVRMHEKHLDCIFLLGDS